VEQPWAISNATIARRMVFRSVKFILSVSNVSYFSKPGKKEAVRRQPLRTKAIPNLKLPPGG
jgi:hypothetical protein